MVGAGGFLPALHNALNGASLTVDAPETMTLSAPFGERDPRLGPIPVPAANAPKGMQPGDRAGLSNGATARVMSVSDEKVVIDANHLYAGEDLTLTVTPRSRRIIVHWPRRPSRGLLLGRGAGLPARARRRLE